jgi:AcrR family transcriptional regulator
MMLARAPTVKSFDRSMGREENAAVPVAANSTKEQILAAAERMIADRGVDGVSMRQIGAAVGSGNNSAVLYHFGSKEKLVEAVFEHRLPGLRARRAELVVERAPSDLRGWIECQIVAVLEQSDVPDSNYLSFVASLAQHGGEAFTHLPKRFSQGQREYEEEVRACLTALEEPLRTHRFVQFMDVTVHTAANRERARALRRPVLPLALEVANLVDCMVGFLTAPVSPESQAALASANSRVVRQALFV